MNALYIRRMTGVAARAPAENQREDLVVESDDALDAGLCAVIPGLHCVGERPT